MYGTLAGRAAQPADQTGTAPWPRTNPLAGFDGYVPDPASLDAEIRIVDRAEFLTRLEPRTGRQVAPGQWKGANRRRPGEPTEHGLRMKLLDRQGEQREERAAGVRRHP